MALKGAVGDGADTGAGDGTGDRVEVSVIMPMRNAVRFVREAAASVLAERDVALELVVVDDGSTDGSREAVAALADARLRLVDGPRRGIAACLNAGIAAARGRVVMRCDADDLYPPGRIARQWRWLAAHPAHGAVCGPYATIDDAGRLVAQMWDERTHDVDDLAAELRAGTARTSLCTWAVRREVLERTGGCREYFETAEDLDLAFRLAEQAPVGYVAANTYGYRLHGESTTHTQPDARRRFFEATAREFARQRATDGADALMRGVAPAPPAGTQAPSPLAEQMRAQLVGQSWRDLAAGDRRAALARAWRAVRSRPRAAGAWVNLLKIALRSARARRAS